MGGGGEVARGVGGEEGAEFGVERQAEAVCDSLFGDFLVFFGEGGDLVEEREAVAEGTAAFLTNETEGGGGDLDSLFLADGLEMRKHEVGRGEAKSENLAAGGDGDRNFFEVSGGEDEDDVGGGFFEGF